MPVGTRAHRGKSRQRWLGLGLAVLLAIAPFARSSVTADLVLPAASVESVVAQDHGSEKAKQPAAEQRPVQPVNLGILSRLSSLEKSLGLLPAKAPPMRVGMADQPRGALRASAAFGDDIGQAFPRSSVGTARTPTGPPA